MASDDTAELVRDQYRAVAQVPTVAHARAAYEAYVDAVGGHSPVTGAALPDWDVLSEQVRTGWLAAAAAARR